MRIFGLLTLGVGFSDRLAFGASTVAVADTATIYAATPDGTQSPSQPTPEEDLLNLQD